MPDLFSLVGCVYCSQIGALRENSTGRTPKKKRRTAGITHRTGVTVSNR
jgi:hypothetical protein